MSDVGADRPVAAYDGASADALASRLGVARLALFDEVASTQDVAHALAASGAPSGTLVLADAQRTGRGRQGRVWQSAAGQGIWLTLVERPADASALDVLSLRLGLHAASALEPFAGAPVRIKWPNDLQIDGRKLAGILVEARWRDGAPDWVAIGFGLNVAPPKGVEGAASLAPGTTRLAVLEALVPALRAAARAAGQLSHDELHDYAARDAARGRRCTAPVEGTVEGISATGELLVNTAVGRASVRAGSLVFAEAPC